MCMRLEVYSVFMSLLCRINSAAHEHGLYAVGFKKALYIHMKITGCIRLDYININDIRFK